LGFWSPDTCEGFQYLVPSTSNWPIFFLEVLVLLSALHHACMYPHPPPTHVAFFTDNTNTVSMFNTLSVLPAYNDILLTAVNWLMATGIQMRIFHIPGHFNSIANALSWMDNATATFLEPHLLV
ncbi:hypothetical protein L208DRAFT_1303849, partial [Tricholoma matsutake]